MYANTGPARSLAGASQRPSIRQAPRTASAPTHSKPARAALCRAANRTAAADDATYEQLTRAESIEITKAALRARRWQQLASLLNDYPEGKLWHINLAALFTQLSRLAPPQLVVSLASDERGALAAFYSQLSSACARAAVCGMGPREVCTIARAAARYGRSQTWLCTAIEDASLALMTEGGVSLRQMAQLTYSFAQMEHGPSTAWVTTLYQVTKLTMAQAALSAALANSPVPNIRSKPRTQATATQSPASQRGLAAHPSKQGSSSSGIDDRVPQALANLAYACVCLRPLQPPPDAAWCQVWLLATQQVLGQSSAEELFQMLRVVQTWTQAPRAEPVHSQLASTQATQGQPAHRGATPEPLAKGTRPSRAALAPSDRIDTSDTMAVSRLCGVITPVSTNQPSILPSILLHGRERQYSRQHRACGNDIPDEGGGVGALLNPGLGAEGCVDVLRVWLPAWCGAMSERVDRVAPWQAEAIILALSAMPAEWVGGSAQGLLDKLVYVYVRGLQAQASVAQQGMEEFGVDELGSMQLVLEILVRLQWEPSSKAMDAVSQVVTALQAARPNTHMDKLHSMLTALQARVTEH